jgi:NAD(P)-dependent dehydrogenase (short-subunit alcohol dehydrogenase family)
MTRTVFITGVLGGIGRATAETFHDAGWRVLGSDRRDHDPIDEIPIDRFLQADIADPQIGATLESFLASIDRLDAVVNNAAMQIEKPLVEMSDGEWDLIMSTNVRAAFIVCRAAYRLLQQSAGAVVNVASVHAYATSPGLAAYAASKGALVALTRASALEFAHAGIRVNAILPGAVDTPMLRSGLNRWSSPEAALQRLADRTPMSRVAEGAEIGRAILFLADGNQSSFITGQALVADGGALARLSTE